jgi:hypothetical protein
MKNADFFRRKMAKIVENSDQNINLWWPRAVNDKQGCQMACFHTKNLILENFGGP